MPDLAVLEAIENLLEGKLGPRHLAALRACDPKRGLRDLEAVKTLAAKAGLDFVQDIAMPANHRCLVFAR